MPNRPLRIPIHDSHTAVVRIAAATQSLIDSWHKGFKSLDRSIDDSWTRGRLGGYEYALGLMLDVPSAEVHRALMAGELPASP